MKIWWLLLNIYVSCTLPMNNYQKRPLKSLTHVIDRSICKNFLSRSSYLTCGPEILLKRYSGISAFRSSRSQLFYKIGVLKNFAKFTEKQLWALCNKTVHEACILIKNTDAFLLVLQNLSQLF